MNLLKKLSLTIFFGFFFATASFAATNLKEPEQAVFEEINTCLASSNTAEILKPIAEECCQATCTATVSALFFEFSVSWCCVACEKPHEK
jgi:hypothetical protein